MRCLVLGGTGAMGIYLVNLLAENGVETIVTSRKIQKEKKNITYLHGNAKDNKFLESILLSHYDVIVDFMSYKTEEFKNRVDLLLSSTKHYIFLSSARVYSENDSIIQETSPLLLNTIHDNDYLKTDEYALAKARQENVLKKSGKTNWTIIRPSLTYNEERLQLGTWEKENWLYRALHGRTIIFSKELYSKITTMTYGLDVSKAILALINNNDTKGETYHITSKESIPWSDVLSIFFNVLEKHLGYKPRVLFQELDTFLKYTPNKHQLIYCRIYNRSFDNTKVSQYININDFLVPEIGLKKCLETFLQNPKFNKIDWKLHGKMDKATKEWTSLFEISGFKNKLKYLKYRIF